MAITNGYDSVLDIKYGVDPQLDGLLLHFMTENNLEYTIAPNKNASSEQIGFMVAKADDEFYAPCSDWMFLQLLKPGLPEKLVAEYLKQWRTLVRLCINFCPDRYIRRRVLSLCRHKFRLGLSSPITIPSRLMKRMLTIFMSQSGVDDPFRVIRQALNRRAMEIVESPQFDTIVNACDESYPGCFRLDSLRFKLDMLEVERLMRISTMTDHWTPEDFHPDAMAAMKIDREMSEDDEDFEPVARVFAEAEGPLKILFLPNRSGGLMVDIQLIKSLLRQGHRVVLALKEGFYFDSPSFWDVDGDENLAEYLKDAHFVSSDKVSKNELIALQKQYPLLVISDGSRERFNPYRCSVTFSRAWKECDLVIAKGEGKSRRLIETSHQFTRDIISYMRDEHGRFRLHYKPRPDSVTKFSEEYIRGKAEEIIAEMREARENGDAVMFYSGIVGSVPGQTDTAIKVMTTYVNHLRNVLDATYIINPAEHFEEGMDADDLMYMWEHVQRSGYITVWRFQTYSDIEQSFALMARKVPAVWAGKDATYSTGCTKEMHIALDVQRLKPEMQIIGPDAEKFFRRREYGVGKFCDVAIDACE